MKFIFLILIGVSSLCYAEYTRDKGVVTDSLTRLQWQDEYGDSNATAEYQNWHKANAYCKKLYLNGRGWRLPTRAELIALVDFDKVDKSIDDVFTQTVGFFYWSSTSHAKYDSNAWRVSFNTGFSNYANKLGKGNIRCMREQK